MRRQNRLLKNNIVTTTKSSRTQGRPRQFDPQQAVEIAQHLFHSRGYDSVSVADLTQALGIKPPSFYAAFGSKLGLYLHVLNRYTRNDAIPISDLLRDDRPMAECLTAVLHEAAGRYAADPVAAGCLVLESIRCNDPGVRTATCELHAAAEASIKAYIARRNVHDAGRLTDYMGTVMAGLSAKARAGYSPERLQEIVRIAGLALEQSLMG
ncbi:TetR/AcrR family transcriptional regulator [Cronobacter sakazakii]|nr:TetR/AcrR family transcriptional regulator [Cronobacter sakazakii]EJG0828597.1 TetR/AcrR family transcriptional regulator [Cronobacter sakazakii]EME1930777.1 TetR/AcrR family transcriptional regulator [Cronobacter sakazakii]EME1934281.1 TetR/AcrR family transcriptional regulator [Cronobacter sakazakii]EME1944874.1 TetR/AcrR family transcriptional regulator [Cronobacter sakazakii]